MAIYTSVNANPYNSVIDSTLANTFSCTIQGNGVAYYKFYIYKISDGSQVYTKSGSCSPILNNNDIFSISVASGTMTNGTNYKWAVDFSSDNSTFVNGFENPFYALKTPTLSIDSFSSNMETNKYSFTATYTQEQSVNLKWFQWFLYDEFNNIIQQSDQIWSITPEYTFTGFVNGYAYQVQVIGLNERGVSVESIKVPFMANFDVGRTLIHATATVDCNRDSVNIEWPKIRQINGTATGTTDYENFNLLTNYKPSVNIADGSFVEYKKNVEIDQNFTKLLVTRLNGDGDIDSIKYQSSGRERNLYTYLGHLYCVGTDGTDLETEQVIMPGRAYKIAERPDSLYIKRFGMSINGGDATNSGSPRRSFNGGTTANTGDPKICIDGGVKRAILLNKNSGIIATNSITNGNFAKDSNADGLADNFTLQNANPVSCTGNTQTFIATAQYGVLHQRPTQAHRYFVTASIKTMSTSVRVRCSDGNGLLPASSAVPTDGQYHTLSILLNVVNPSSASWAIMDFGSSGWQPISVQNFMAIDMGTADNPTPFYDFDADKMANLFPTYIEGTVNGESSDFQNMILLGSGVNASNFNTVETLNGGGVNEFNANL